MQTFPCGHRVVCRKCFVKTIQMAVSQRMLPLRCVICRTKIIRLKQTTSGFATPASHTAHLANTRACLLRQSNAVDADGFGRAPFITPDDYVKPLQPNKPQISKQECRFHRHWKNKVAAAPLPHDVTESLNENDLNKRIEMRPSLYKEDRKKKQAVKGTFPHLDTPGPAKIVKKASTSILTHVSLNPTIAVGSSFSSHKTSNLSIVPAPSGDEHVISDGATKNSRNQKKSKFEGVLKDHEDIHAIAENELDIIPLTQLGKPQSPVGRQSAQISYFSQSVLKAVDDRREKLSFTTENPRSARTALTASFCAAPDIHKAQGLAERRARGPCHVTDYEDNSPEAHLIITTHPIKKLEFRTERHSLPDIPPPKLTLVDPQKGDRQLSILDNSIDEEDELLLTFDDDSVSSTRSSGAEHVSTPIDIKDPLNVLASPASSKAEVRIAPPPDFRRRSHRVAPESRLLQKCYHPPATRFEKFKQFHVKQPMQLFSIPEHEERDSAIAACQLSDVAAEGPAFNEGDYRTAAPPLSPLPLSAGSLAATAAAAAEVTLIRANTSKPWIESDLVAATAALPRDDCATPLKGIEHRWKMMNSDVRRPASPTASGVSCESRLSVAGPEAVRFRGSCSAVWSSPVLSLPPVETLVPSQTTTTASKARTTVGGAPQQAQPAPAVAFFKADEKLAVSQSLPLISADNMVTVGGSFLNSATRTKMALLSSFRQLRSKSPLKAFGVRSSRKYVPPSLLNVSSDSN